MSSLGDKPDTSRKGLNRALPGWAIDIIRFGIPHADYRAIYSALVSIAMSAHLRGWSEAKYIREISYTYLGSRLWIQMRIGSDGKHRRSDKSAIRELRKAWEQGVANANNVGCRTLEEIRDDAIELAFQWVDRLVDNPDDLSPTEMSVMEYVISETDRRGMLKVTCPSREVAEFAKVSVRTAFLTLKALTDRGLLVKHSGGRPQGKYGGARAAIYGLTDPGSLPTELGKHIHTGRFPYVYLQPVGYTQPSLQAAGRAYTYVPNASWHGSLVSLYPTRIRLHSRVG